MKYRLRPATALLTPLLLAPLLRGDSTVGNLNEQVAAHFEQIFAPANGELASDRERWLPGDERDPNWMELEVQLKSRLGFALPSRIKGTDRRLASTTNQVELSLTFPFRSGDRLNFTTRAVDYRMWESGAGSDAFFPYDRITTADFGLSYTRHLSPKWSLFLGAATNYSESNGPGMQKRFEALGFVGGSYTFNPRLRLAIGLLASTAEYGESGPYPMFHLEWQFAERHRLLISDGLFYQYALTSDWRDVLGVSFEMLELAVSLEAQEVAGTWRRHPTLVAELGIASLSYRHRFTNGLELEAKVGVTDGGEHAIYGGNDHRLSGVEMENAFASSLGLRYRF